MLFTKFNMMAEIQAECVLQRIILFKDRVLRTEIWISEKVRQNSNNVSQTDSHVSVLKGCWRPIVRLSHPHTAIWHLNCAFIIWVCLGKLSSLERNIDDTTGIHCSGTQFDAYDSKMVLARFLGCTCLRTRVGVTFSLLLFIETPQTGTDGQISGN